MKKNKREKNAPASAGARVEVTVRRFIEAPEGKRFLLSDGRILKDVKELADALEHMSDDVFRHHVNESRNDFSNWTRDILQEKELAEDLQKLDSQLHAQISVLKHIAKKAFRKEGD